MGGLIWIAAGDSDGEERPGPLVADLQATDWRFPTDPHTGYQRLATPLRESTRFDRIAVGAEGRIAIGARLDETRPWVLVWHGGRWEGHAFQGKEAITALALDPDGTVHVGFSDGSLARIGTAGEVVDEGVVESGYSIVGFAFDRGSKRSALMLSGGEVRTGLRPLRRELLHTVTMPPRARIRKLSYSSDGQLVVAGDAGALFVATEDGWREGSLPTPGNVTALGLDGDGDLLVAQANGHVFSGSGVTWDRLGQVSGNPVAVGGMPEHGVVVVTADGRIYGTLGRDDFSEMPGYRAPADVVVDDAQVAGHDVLIAARNRVLVWDGQLFDSTQASEGEGTVGNEGCVAVGPRSRGSDRVPQTVFDCGQGRHAVFTEGSLSDVEVIQVAGEVEPADDFASAVREARRRGAIWIGGRPWAPNARGNLPGIERWSYVQGEWQPVASVEPELGDVLDLSAVQASDGWELWATTQNGTAAMARIHPGRPAGEVVALTPIADHGNMQELYGEDFFPGSVEIHALGEGRALVIHDGWRASVVSQGPEGVQPLALFSEPPMFRARTVRIGDGILLVEGDRIRRITGGSPPEEWTVPDGVDLGLGAGDTGPFDVAARERDGEVLLRAAGGTLLRCRNAACETVPLPPWVRPVGVLYAPDGRVVVLEAGGLVGIITLPAEG